MTQTLTIPEHRRTTGRSANPIIAALSFCGIVVALMQTLVVPLIPQLPELLNTSAANASWVITATLLAGAVVTPISGRLGDMFGKRRMLLISLGSLIVGSVICALTAWFPAVLMGRVLQGAATGAIPLGISILRDELPAERVGSAMAIVSATLGVGGAIGLPLAAAIAQWGNWHVLFWTAAGLGAAAIVWVLAIVPESPVKTRTRFDYAGAVGLSLGLVALLLAISKGGDWGWASPMTLSLLATSAVVLVLWGMLELRTKAPLVDLRVSARRQVLFTNFASVAVGFAMYGMSLSLPQLLMSPTSTGYGLGLPMLQAGLALAPGGITMMALSPVSARISARRGPRVTLLIGSLVIAAGYALALLLDGAVWQIIVASMIISGGIGLAYAAMPALIMAAVPVSETASANGLNTLMRSVGTSTSAAVVAVVLASQMLPMGAASVPSHLGFQLTFVIGIAAALLSAVLTALIPRQRW